jgi:hypothetical protein
MLKGKRNVGGQILRNEVKVQEQKSAVVEVRSLGE